MFIGRTDAEAETPILWPPHAKRWLIGKGSDSGRDWGQQEKGTTEDEMAGWHHRLDGCDSEWTLGVGDGQGGLVCCDSWGRKESDTTEQLNWTENQYLRHKDINCVAISRIYCKMRILWITAKLIFLFKTLCIYLYVTSHERNILKLKWIKISAQSTTSKEIEIFYHNGYWTWISKDLFWLNYLQDCTK